MAADHSIVPTTPEHLPALMALYPAAFPEEDLTGLVTDLVSVEPAVVSLVARGADGIVGHIALTLLTDQSDAPTAALLGPLAVHPSVQRAGLGRALIGVGSDRVAHLGASHLLVLGDPAYYGQFGFQAEPVLQPPYPLPQAWHAAWQSKALISGALPLPDSLIWPEIWKKQEYWV